MKNIKHSYALKSIISLILLLAVVCSCVSCGVSSAQDAILGKESVRYKLLEYELPEFNGELFGAVEICFNERYYKELEDYLTLAEKTYNAYQEFCLDVVNPESVEEVTLALIDCYIYAVGDRYAFYRTKEESDDFNSDMSGTFVGIGVSVVSNILESTIEVLSTEPNSPAAEAGISTGDFIVAVDGVRVSEIGTKETVNRIRGEVGTSVEVTVDRNGTEITFTMSRRQITEVTVRYEMINDSKIGYIEITGFKGNTAAQFISAVNAVEAAGAEAIIFDLRNNPGGYMTTVQLMLSYLVPDGTLIASFSKSKSPIYASSKNQYEPTDHVLSIPSVVLCNENSASASELFVGAMRDYNDMGLFNATIAGQTTYKKGVMQSTIVFNDDSSLTLTTTLYNPPSGQNFHEIGVSPDVFIENDEEYLQKAVEIADSMIKEINAK